MPFGSYEFEDSDVALKNAYRFVKEAGVNAVKMEVRQTAWKVWEHMYVLLATPSYFLKINSHSMNLTHIE